MPISQQVFARLWVFYIFQNTRDVLRGNGGSWATILLLLKVMRSVVLATASMACRQGEGLRGTLCRFGVVSVCDRFFLAQNRRGR
ncbi:hypothetical protein BJI49_06835 [Acetobacter pasteurianus]|nr:hypothetical protein BJI49_06835 [Acetobacter pasteurianus]